MATMEDQTIAQHATSKGYGIAVIRNGYSNGKIFLVARTNPGGQYITIHDAKSEAEARELANREWLADVGQARAMIY